jgi:nucleotide-binding universal stress UspA family protein
MEYPALDKMKEWGTRDDLPHEARDRLRDLLVDAGIEKAGMIEAGEPYKKRLSFCSEDSIELIVMGARRRSRIKEMLIGRVTEPSSGWLPVLCSWYADAR